MKALMRIILSHRWVGGHRGSMGWGHEGVFQVARCRTWSSGRLGIELEWVSRVTAAVERENRLHFFSFFFLTTQQNMKRTERKKKVEAKKEIKPLDHPPGFFFFFLRFIFEVAGGIIVGFFLLFMDLFYLFFICFFLGGSLISHLFQIDLVHSSFQLFIFPFSLRIESWMKNEFIKEPSLRWPLSAILNSIQSQDHVIKIQFKTISPNKS